MSTLTTHKFLILAALSGALLLTAGCGGGGGGLFFDPTGSVDVSNGTFFDDVTYFELYPFSGGSSGDVVGPYIGPGTTAYVGEFFEDFYDADALLFFGGLRTFSGVFVEGGLTTDFTVF